MGLKTIRRSVRGPMGTSDRMLAVPMGTSGDWCQDLTIWRMPLKASSFYPSVKPFCLSWWRSTIFCLTPNTIHQDPSASMQTGRERNSRWSCPIEGLSPQRSDHCQVHVDIPSCWLSLSHTHHEAIRVFRYTES